MKKMWSRFRDQIKKHPAVPWFIGVVALLFISMIAVFSRGSTGAFSETGETAGQPGTLGLLVDVIIKFGIVLFLIYVFYQLLQKFSKRKGSEGSSQLSVLETLKLSPQQSLHLIKVHDGVMLIGATDASLTHLSEVELPQEIIQSYRDETPPTEFPQILRETLKSKFGRSEEEQAREE